jgi:ABC-type multidrug transport system permease subunit
MGFMRFFVILYALAMAATAVAVLLGCSVTDPKMGQEFLPVLFMPQILFSGLFIPTGFIPVWLR